MRNPFYAIGLIIAVILSWGINHSIIWAIIHGFFSWFYVVWHLMKY